MGRFLSGQRGQTVNLLLRLHMFESCPAHIRTGGVSSKRRSGPGFVFAGPAGSIEGRGKGSRSANGESYPIMDTKTLAFAFNAPPRIVVEWGGATNGKLAREAKTRGTRPLLAAGKSLEASGTLGEIVDSLRAAGIVPVLHVGVPPEPDLANVEAALSVCRGEKCDSVLAIGGGSVMDVAKAVGGLAPSGLSVRDVFAGNAQVPEAGGLPILTVPTTAGTGSEVTWVGVFTDKASGVKKASIRGGAMMPRVAFLDARLTVSCPHTVTVYSGMDAFVQAVEAYTSLGANPLTDALALDAAVLVLRGLASIVGFRGIVGLRDKESRTEAEESTLRSAYENAALGSLMAGMALNTSRLGLVHGLAHPLGAVTGAPHGLLCGLLMPAVIRFNENAATEKYARLARALEIVDGPAPDDVATQDLLGFVTAILAAFGIPSRLRDIGLTEADLDFVARETLPSGSTKANPRPVSFDDARQVAESCL